MSLSSLVNDGNDNSVMGHYDTNLNVVIDDPKPVMHYFINIKRTPVIAELVALASERTNAGVEYRDTVGTYEDMDRIDAMEAFDQGYDPVRQQETSGSLWCDNYRDKGAFWAELNRLQELVKKPLDEPILEDDHPVYQGYLYVADGIVRQFIDGENMTVARWKALRIPHLPDVKEVRSCDMEGRRARLPKMIPLAEARREIEKGSITSNGQSLHQNQKRRRPRSSNKIKKVR